MGRRELLRPGVRALEWQRIRPRRVRPGEQIGVVAPAGVVRPDRLEAGLAELHRLGFRTLLGESVHAQRGYLAGTDAQRLADLEAMWRRPDVAAIVCARGGFGCTRIVARFDWELARRRPIPFVGFSDVTAFHLALWRHAGLVTFHGPMVEADPADPVDSNWRRLYAALTQPGPLGPIERPPDAPPVETIVPGTAEGVLLGGNLTLVCGSLGTPWQIDATGAILLLEDVDEQPYAIDRMLHQLKAAGVLDACAGVVFGESVGCLTGREGRPSLTLREVLDDVFLPLGKPVIYGLAAGHGRHRLTLPLGCRARLDAGSRLITIEEAAVS